MPRQLLFKKKILEELYLDQKLSTDSIAQKYKCSHVTVINYLVKYKIPRRSRLGNRIAINLTKEALSELYEHKKWSQKRIAKASGHSLHGIQNVMKKYGIKSRSYSVANTKYPKNDFSGNKIEKAYLIGFRLGDLNVYKVHELIQARCSTTINEQADLITKLFRNYGNVRTWKAKRGTFEIVVLLNRTFDFLLPKNDSINKWILSSKQYFLSFLAGYADAEGSYFLRRPYHKKSLKPPWGLFEVQSYDEQIIQTFYNQLLYLNIECKLSHPKQRQDQNGNMCRLSIVKKQSLWNFIKLVEQFHKHTKKIEDLRKVKENIIYRNSVPYSTKVIL